ncbi:DNA polymerase/3'-5' exonuclease PolX [Pseudomonadota bacterium]
MPQEEYSNQDIANIMRQLAAVLEVKGESIFRIRAYSRAADAIEQSSSSLKWLQARGKLTTIPGVGTAIATKIEDLLTTGKSKQVDHILRQVPAGMFALMEVPGIGPKKANKLAKKFKLNNQQTAIESLKKQADLGKIAPIEGFAQKSQTKLLTSLKSKKRKTDKKIKLDKALTISHDLISQIKVFSGVKQVEVLGSLRRHKETVGDIDIGICTDNPDAVTRKLQTLPSIQNLIAAGTGLVRFTHQSGQNVDVKLIPTNSWGSLLQHFTGSKAHNIALREYALKKNMSLSEHGIRHKNQLLTFTNERDFYNQLGLMYIPPELREDRGEIEAAKEKTLPVLISNSNIQGDLHTHTNYSWTSSHDYGSSSPAKLVSTAKKLKYRYLGLGDHNPSTSKYSNKQIVEVIRQRTHAFRQHSSNQLPILVTLEVDIRTNGSLAIPDEATKHLDYIVASIHSGLTSSKSDLTNRTLSAISHPKVKILGHPTGRIIGKRPSFQLDWDKIFTACTKHHTSLEINAHPSRLDLSDQLVRLAVGKKVKLAINTDAHSTSDLYNMPFGVNVARRGWATKADIINTYNYPKLIRWLKKT